jgi:hypothetical protein
MAVKLPLVITAGVVQQLQAGDSIATSSGGLALSQHVLGTNFTITAGYSAYVTRYMELAAGVTLEIGLDGDLEIG